MRMKPSKRRSSCIAAAFQGRFLTSLSTSHQIALDMSPWIIDCPHNLRENGDRSEVPVWWLGRELDLFSACHYLGIPGGALYAVGKVFGWGCIEAPPLPDHNPQLMECVNALMENMYCSPDASPDPEDLEVT